MANSVEVELKFRTPDASPVREAVRAMGGRPSPRIEQVDTYFAHPVRDFAASDEAFRVRRVGEGGCLTYKGPLLDRETKSREETEISFAGGAADAARFAAVLERLGFTPVRDVRKHREPWSLDWQGYDVEVALDDVDGLGTFVEIEITTEPTQFDAARQAVLDLAAALGLRDSERRSYLALLLSAGRT